MFDLFECFFLLLNFVKLDSSLISDKKLENVTGAEDPVENNVLFYIFFNYKLSFGI